MKRTGLMILMAVLFLALLSLNGAIAADLGTEEELQNDYELAELVAKYAKLLHNQSLSADELAELIAEDESKMAKHIGVQIRYSDGVERAELQGLCINNPIWWPGKVKWNFPNPGGDGAQYSVKSEHDEYLIWANPPEQDIDGIYRRVWGNCVAYKIPNGATATFHNAEYWDVCYNLFACKVLGKCPGWVDPCSMGDWPDSPL